MSLKRFNLGFWAVLLVLVAVVAAMFAVPNVAPPPTAVVQATVEQVAPVAPVAEPVSEVPVAEEQAESIIATPFAGGAVMANITEAYEGSTLWAIAKQTCGDGKRWKDIMTLNGLSTPEQLKPGHVLIPSDCDPSKRAAPSSKSSSPALVAKAAPPAPIVKVVAPVVQDPSEIESLLNTEIVLFDCSKPRPTSATPEGKYFERWIAQCGETYFSGPGVYEDVELYEDGTITRTRVADYQLRQAEKLVQRIDFLYRLFIKNPDTNSSHMRILELCYHGDTSHPGLKQIKSLTWVDAEYVLDFAEDMLDTYTDSWVKEQRLAGAFLPPFWRKIFSYTVPKEEPDEDTSEALAAGS